LREITYSLLVTHTLINQELFSFLGDHLTILNIWIRQWFVIGIKV
jgi:hypothetical protein